MIKLTILWLLFFFSHSFLATPSVKTILEPVFKTNYRLFYNAVAAVLMTLIICHLLRMRSEYVLNPPVFLKWIGVLLLLPSVWILKEAFKNMNLSSFLGFSKTDESGGRLITEGVYQWVRHPLYFGTTLFFIALFLMIPTDSILLSIVFGFVYIIIGIEFEEAKLRQIFGEEYTQYVRGKKKFLPFLY
jgi:methanethiol S-methyltransferase